MTYRNRYEGLKATLVISLFSILLVVLFFWNTHEGFHVPKITGKAIATTTTNIVSAELDTQCTIALFEDWNLISIGCRNNTNTSIANRLESIKNDYISIHTYNGSDSADPWKAHARGLPDYVVSDLEEHRLEDGYWLRMGDPGTLSTIGVRVVPTFIEFGGNWTLFGFPTNESMNISQALLAQDGKYNRIQTYNETTGAWHVYIPNGTSNLTMLDPGQGYWINGTEGGFITII